MGAEANPDKNGKFVNFKKHKRARNKKRATFLGNESEFNDHSKFGFRRLKSSAGLIEYFGDDA